MQANIIAYLRRGLGPGIGGGRQNGIDYLAFKGRSRSLRQAMGRGGPSLAIYFPEFRPATTSHLGLMAM